MALSEAETARYARQLILPGFVPVTQEFLKAARVQVVGAGEVAATALLYLAAAGVGSLLVDDALDLAPEDAAAWPYAGGELGEPRMYAAIKAVRAVNALCKVRPYATGTDPTAVLISIPSPGTAREAAERARLAGLPHVVALGNGDDGEVVSVPAGAPCCRCGSRLASGVPARPGTTAAVLGTLAALELLQILAGLVEGPAGRRVDLALGMPRTLATNRVAGCACARPRTF
jgi:molybdopterin-synthase adenylyltransferase